MQYRRAKFVIAIFLWLVPSICLAQSLPLAEQVSATRAEADALAHQLENQRQEIRGTLSALRMERTELQRQIRLEEIRRDTLNQIQVDRTKRVDDQEDRVKRLLGPVRRSIASAKKYVSSTLPFKQDERMRLLNKIEAEVAVTHPDPAKALTKIWRFVEEEQAMAKEIALTQQAISFEEQRVLVDVVRIGMAIMYFRLPNKDTGWVRKQDGVWRFERITAPSQQKVISKIFEDLENNRILGPKQLLISTELPSAVTGGIQ